MLCRPVHGEHSDPNLLLLHASARLPGLPRRREHLRVGQRSRVLLVVPVLRGGEVVAPVAGVVERVVFRAPALSLASRRRSGRGLPAAGCDRSAGCTGAVARGAGGGGAAVPTAASGLGRGCRRGGPGVNTAAGKPAARPSLLLPFGTSLAVGSVSALLISGGRVEGPPVAAAASGTASAAAAALAPPTGRAAATASTPAAWLRNIHDDIKGKRQQYIINTG